MISEGGREAYMMIRQSSYWERNYRDADVLTLFKDQHDFNADIVIYRLGENVPNEMKPDFPGALREFIEYICPKGSRVIFTSCFWKNPLIDTAIRELASTRGESYVDSCCPDDSMMALGLFEHKGVAMHPGDKGMQMIAERIFSAI